MGTAVRPAGMSRSAWIAVGCIGALVALIFGVIRLVDAASLEHSDVYALATAYAASSAEVRARVGPVVASTLAARDSHCVSTTEIPPTGDATFTLLVRGAREHAKLDIRAARDEKGWRLVAARMRPTDDALFAVASGCPTGPAYGPAGPYGKA